MELDISSAMKWLTTLSPDKLALLLPFAIAYAIIRSRRINTALCWVICPVVAALLFGILGERDPAHDEVQGWTNRLSIGSLFGFIAALLALGLHSAASKWLVEKVPALKFLVLLDEPPTQSAPPESKPGN